MRKTTTFLQAAGLLLAIVLVLTPSAFGAMYDLATDWSDSANSNGVWTY